MSERRDGGRAARDGDGDSEGAANGAGAGDALTERCGVANTAVADDRAWLGCMRISDDDGRAPPGTRGVVKIQK